MADFGTYSTQMDFVEKLSSFATNELGGFQEELSVASSFANALCGLFAVFYIANIVWKSWVSGGQIDLYKCVKPFIIGFIIINFTYMTAAVDFVAEGFTECSRAFVTYEEAKSKQMNEQFYEAMKTMDASKIKPVENVVVAVKDTIGSNTGNGQPDKTDVQAAIENVGSWFQNNFTKEAIMLSIQSAFQNAFTWLAQLLSSLVACCIVMLSFVCRCVLCFFGPLVFALSLLPSSDGLIMSWLRKYLTYSLYPALLNIINGVMCGAMCMSVTGLAGSTGKADLLEGTGWELCYINLALMAISVVSIFIYLSVPSIAGQIVDVGTNAIGGVVAGASSYMVSKAGNSLAKTSAMQRVSSGLGTASIGMVTGGLGFIPSAYNFLKGRGSSRKEAKKD